MESVSPPPDPSGSGWSRWSQNARWSDGPGGGEAADQDDGPRPDATGHTVCDVSTTEAGAGLRTVARVSRAQRPRAGVEKVLLRN